jgi:hypothetical protein
LSLVLVAAGGLKGAEPRPASESWERQGGEFVVRFAGRAQEALARQAIAELRRAKDDLRQRFGVTPAGTVEVVIYTEGAYAENTKPKDWELARFDGKIRISKADILARAGHLRTVLYHEYMHALLLPAGDLPAWFHEGLAQWVEPEGAYDAAETVRAAIAGGAWMPLAELEQGFLRFDDQASAALAYAESLAIVQYLLHARGEARLRGFVQQLVQDRGGRRQFDALLAERYAQNAAALERDFLQSLKRRKR